MINTNPSTDEVRHHTLLLKISESKNKLDAINKNFLVTKNKIEKLKIPLLKTSSPENNIRLAQLDATLQIADAQRFLDQFFVKQTLKIDEAQCEIHYPTRPRRLTFTPNSLIFTSNTLSNLCDSQEVSPENNNREVLTSPQKRAQAADSLLMLDSGDTTKAPQRPQKKSKSSNCEVATKQKRKKVKTNNL